MIGPTRSRNRPDGSRGLGREAGAASAQVALAMPAVVFVLLVVFQFALYQFGSQVVTAAAREGAQEATAERGSAAAGDRAARAVTSRVGSGLLRGLDVSVSRGRDRTRAVVQAEVVSLIPGLRSFSVTGVADGPTERFRSRSER